MGDYVDQADFAGRIGKIANTYQKVAKTSEDNIYEATLHVCLLHTLLTSCDAVLDLMENQIPPEITVPLQHQDTQWGLNASMIETRFRDEQISVLTAIRHMRNAVSHPTPWKASSKNDLYPSTGFYRSSVNDEQIAAFTFINSPDVGKYGLMGKDKNKAEKFLEDHRSNLPEDATIGLIEPIKRGQYAVYSNGKPYVRFFRIDIPIASLQEFVQELSCFLYEQFGNKPTVITRIDCRENGRRG